MELLAQYHSGQYDWRGAGRISSSAASFAGRFAFDAYPRLALSGTLDGRFYGPQAQELGAAIVATSGEGAIFAGTITGKRDAAAAPPTLALTNVVPGSQFFTVQGSVTYDVAPDGRIVSTYLGDITAIGRITYGADGSYRVHPQASSSSLPSPTFRPEDRIAAESNARYTVFEKREGGEDFRLTLHKPGAGNDELPLTYTSFGVWERRSPRNGNTQVDRNYFAYGVPTPANILARSGSASYTGTFFGAGVDDKASKTYKMSGDALLDIDFNAMRFGGSLHVLGTDTSNQLRDFGTWTFGGEMSSANAFQSSLVKGGYSDGYIDGRLFGPAGEEMGASVELGIYNAQRFGEMSISGVVVGKKR